MCVCVCVCVYVHLRHIKYRAISIYIYISKDINNIFCSICVRLFVCVYGLLLLLLLLCLSMLLCVCMLSTFFGDPSCLCTCNPVDIFFCEADSVVVLLLIY
eukprot:GHVR01039647.1.p1 GENE.GHVR01039647.1~~GHVR01039647.1.p1  ORF type:complete len:101 (-),score=27.77 GHVR01039647.1:164-466(-)